jgi:hypothetical protein
MHDIRRRFPSSRGSTVVLMLGRAGMAWHRWGMTVVSALTLNRLLWLFFRLFLVSRSLFALSLSLYFASCVVFLSVFLSLEGRVLPSLIFVSSFASLPCSVSSHPPIFLSCSPTAYSAALYFSPVLLGCTCGSFRCFILNG